MPRWRADSLAHFRTVRRAALDAATVEARGRALQDLIRPALTADRNRLYALDLFEKNLLEDVSLGQGAIIINDGNIPGIVPLVRARAEGLDSRAGRAAPDHAPAEKGAEVWGGPPGAPPTARGPNHHPRQKYPADSGPYRRYRKHVRLDPRQTDPGTNHGANNCPDQRCNHRCGIPGQRGRILIAPGTGQQQNDARDQAHEPDQTSSGTPKVEEFDDQSQHCVQAKQKERRYRNCSLSVLPGLADAAGVDLFVKSSHRLLGALGN